MANRSTIFLIAAAAALALLGPGTSSAAEWEWNLESFELIDQTESETISGTGGTFTLATTIGESSVTISCESVELTNATITPEGKGASTVSLSGCQVVGQPTCTVSGPINLKASTDSLTSSVSSQLFNRYVPAESKFATVKISVCKFAGEYAVEGSFAGEFEGGEERVEEPIAFSPKIGEAAGTSLKFGGKTATVAGSITIAASGAFAGQDVAPTPLDTDPPVSTDFGGVNMGKSKTMSVTHTVLGKKEEVKFGTVQIVGGAGVFSIDKEDCGGKTKKPTETCTITVKFTPAAKVGYMGVVVTPWETMKGDRFGVRSHRLAGTGT